MLRCYVVTLRPTMWHTGTCGHGSCSTLVSNVIKVDSENIAKHAISAPKNTSVGLFVLVVYSNDAQLSSPANIAVNNRSQIYMKAK